MHGSSERVASPTTLRSIMESSLPGLIAFESGARRRSTVESPPHAASTATADSTGSVLPTRHRGLLDPSPASNSLVMRLRPLISSARSLDAVLRGGRDCIGGYGDGNSEPFHATRIVCFPVVGARRHRARARYCASAAG